MTAGSSSSACRRRGGPARCARGPPARHAPEDLARLDAEQLTRLAHSLGDVHQAIVGLVQAEGADAFGIVHDHGQAHAHAHSYPEATSVGRTVAH